MNLHLARVLIVVGDAKQAAILSDGLERNSYIVDLCLDGESLLPSISAQYPDVVIVGPELPDKSGQDVLALLKSDPSTDTIPILFLTPEPLGSVGDDLLAAGTDAFASWPIDGDTLASRIRPLARISTMRAELRVRNAAVREIGAKIPSKPIRNTQNPPAFLVAGSGRDAETVAVTFPGAEIVRAPDLIETQRHLGERLFDAAILCPASRDEVEAFLDQCALMRRNPRLFNLPVVFVADPHWFPTDQDAFSQGASAVLPSLDPQATLSVVLQSLVRQQRLRWTIRQALGQTLGPETCDDWAPGVYSYAFFQRYLARRIAFAKERKSAFSLIRFSFVGVDTLRHEYGEESEQNLVRQLSQWIALLVRAEDTVARVSESSFAVALPDTPLSEAQFVMHRIAGVIANTEFAVKEVYRPVGVWPDVGAAALTESDDMTTLMERASVDVG